MEGNNQQYGNGGMKSAAAAAFGISSSSGDYAEEAPPMRAVAISSLPAELQFGAPKSFGKAPPLGIVRPGPLASQGRAPSVCVKKEWNESSWSVKTLEQVPLGFPLERTHREIHDADANAVAKRISNALTKLSVEAEYDGENAKAKCTSTDMVSFRIRLFAGNDDGLPVVVEVQRRSGSSSSFMKICRQILNGAEGSEVKFEDAANKKMPPFVKGSISGMKCLQSVVAKEEVSGENEAIEKSMELLRSKQKDSNLLGLENLCLVTDPIKTRPDVAFKSCKAVIMEDRCSELREELGVILQNDAFEPEEFDDEADPFAKKSRHLALQLLANSLVLTSKDGCLADAVESKKYFADFLIPALIDEVKSFKVSSNNSYEAACCLTSLASCSDVARRLLRNHGAVEDLRAAYHHGLENHELLASEAEEALVAMGESTV
jgi:hypothetical protein